MVPRILHIHDKPPGTGGLRRHVDDLVALAPRAGWQASALQIAAVGQDAVSGAGAAPLPRSYGPSPSSGKLVRTVVERIAAEEPDILHLHAGFTAMSRAVLAALAARWPAVATLHDVAPFCLNGRRLLAANGTPCRTLCGSPCLTTGCGASRGVVGFAAGTAHHLVKSGLRTAWLGLGELIVPSAYLRSLALAHGASARAMTLIPHAIRSPAFTPLPDGAPLILFVGNMTRDKGADLVIEALFAIERLPWTACLVGDGPLRGPLEEAVARRGLGERIAFLGRLSSAEIARLRQRSFLAVMPSRVMESFGLAGLESLAAGRPVVASARGGITQWLRHGRNGFGFDPDKPHDLAEALAALLLDRVLAARMAEQAHAMVAAEFAPSLFAARLDAVYRRALDGFQPLRRSA